MRIYEVKISLQIENFFRFFKVVNGRLADLFGSFREQRMEVDVKVLMFHRVGEPGNYLSNRGNVSEEELDTILKELNRSHQFVHLKDIASWLIGETDLEKNSVAVTFDDGFLSVKEKALPILEKYEVPATVYVPSNFIEIEYNAGFRVDKLLEQEEKLDFGYRGKSYFFDLDSEEKKVEAREQIFELFRKSSLAEIENFMDEIGAESANGGRLMDKEELREFDESDLISIGAHSTDHRRLTDLEPEEAKKSIFESKERLGDVLGHEVSSFSFPFGSKNRKLVKAVEEAGFDNAVVTEEREISERDWRKVYRIPRIDGRDLQ